MLTMFILLFSLMSAQLPYIVVFLYIAVCIGLCICTFVLYIYIYINTTVIATRFLHLQAYLVLVCQLEHQYKMVGVDIV